MRRSQACCKNGECKNQPYSFAKKPTASLRTGQGEGFCTWQASLFMIFVFLIYISLSVSQQTDLGWASSNGLKKDFEPSQSFVPSLKSSTLSAEDTEEYDGFSMLISSHQTLIQYFPAINKFKVLDIDHGVYYGQVTLPQGDIYVTGSAGYTEPKDRVPLQKKKDTLMRLDVNTMRINMDETIPLSSFFTHDSIAYGDKILVTNTFEGNLDVYERSSSGYSVIQSVSFGKRSHVNSISSYKDYVFVLLNNLGISEVAVLRDYKTVCTISNIGRNNHNIIISDESTDNQIVFYSLSSNEAQLVKISFLMSDCEVQSSAVGEKQLVLQYFWGNTKAPFLKGLMIVNKIAFFGVSEFTGNRRERATVETRLVAFDVSSGRTLYERTSTETGVKGLINVIGSPLISSKSTFTEFSTNQLVVQQALEIKPIESKHIMEEDVSLVEDSPRANYLNKLVQLSRLTGIDYGYTDSGVYFIKLPLKLDVQQLQKDLDLLLTDIDWTFRKDVNNYFLLLVTNAGSATDESKVGPFMPVDNRLERTAYTRKVLSSLGAPVGRSRYMMLPSGESVKLHKDRTAHLYTRKGRRRSGANSRIHELFGPRYQADSKAGYWGRRFRVHIPVYSNSKVIFKSESVSLYMEPGYAYLFDNASPHEVHNPSSESRTHLVFDTVSSPMLFELVCHGSAVVQAEEKGSPQEVPFLEYYDEEYKSIFKNTQINNPETTEYFVDPNSAEKKIYYEKWVDREVFWPMESSAITSAWNSLSDDVASTKEEKEKLSGLLDDFLSSYEETCYEPFKNQKDYIKPCEEYTERFQKKLFASELATTKEYEYEIDIVSALSSLLKTIFYQCEATSAGFLRGPRCF